MLRFLKYLSISYRSLLDHKLRSFLTILGIIFGVAAVIAMTAIGEGAKEQALREIQALGINNIYIKDIQAIRNSAHEKGQYISDGLNKTDISYLAQSINTINAWTLIKEKELFVQAPSFSGALPIRGIDGEYATIIGLNAYQGRTLHPLDVTNGHRVCVLGLELADKIFRGIRPVGSYLRINDRYFQVVGVLENKPDYNNILLIPYNEPLLHEKREDFEPSITSAVFYIADISRISTTATLIKRSIIRRHFDINDFEITVPEALLRQQEHTQNIFNSIMILITSISLLVGGIGIMNIMLASVLERTREIGIRRGMGATKNDIKQQFLAEAIVLTSAGGVIGVIVGILLTMIIGWTTGWSTHIPLFAVILSFSFSVLIGVMFGYYPAKNASEMSPIDALRYE